MKKDYIKPVAKAHKINPMTLLAGSDEVGKVKEQGGDQGGNYAKQGFWDYDE